MTSQTMHKSVSRTVFLDLLRVVATFAVIIIHVCADYWLSGQVNSFEWLTLTAYETLSRWSVPIFVMISGALFLNPNKEISIRQIFFKKILRLVTAYLFWSFAHALIENNFTSDISVLLVSTINGPGHLWFIPMIIGLYMIVPFLKTITQSSKLSWYFVALFAIFTTTLPTLFTFINYIDINTLSAIANPLNHILESSHFFFTLGYAGYFVLGYILNNTELSKKKKTVIYIVGIISFIATLALTIFCSVRSDKPVNIFFNYLTTNILLESIAVFVFFKNILTKIKFSSKAGYVIEKLSKYSFAIYLCHMLVLKVAGKFGLTGISFNPVIAVPITSIFVFVIALAISIILHKIPFFKKFIV